MRPVRLAICFAFALAALGVACSVPPRTGWERGLRSQLVDVGARFAAGAAILSGLAPASRDGELVVGDELLFGVLLENGAQQRIWYLRLRVLALETGSGMGGRRQTPFERRVQPSPARRRELAERSREAWEAFQSMDPEERWQFACARVQVDAFDAAAAPLSMPH